MPALVRVRRPANCAVMCCISRVPSSAVMITDCEREPLSYSSQAEPGSVVLCVRHSQKGADINIVMPDGYLMPVMETENGRGFFSLFKPVLIYWISMPKPVRMEVGLDRMLSNLEEQRAAGKISDVVFRNLVTRARSWSSALVPTDAPTQNEEIARLFNAWMISVSDQLKMDRSAVSAALRRILQLDLVQNLSEPESAFTGNETFKNQRCLIL